MLARHRSDNPLMTFLTRTAQGLSFFGCVVASALLPADLSTADSLDARIVTVMREAHAPGLSYAVTHAGRTVRLGSFGVASVEHHAPVVKDTRFEIASMSKMFAATAIRILADEGKVNLEDPVAKYLQGLPDTLKGMRVKHLLGMSIGWPDDWDVLPWGNIFIDFDDSSTMAMFRKLPILSPLGAKFHYSSPGYAMLGMIVQKVTGESYARFVEERIFRKAGMTHSAFVDPGAVVPERADGYIYDEGALKRGYYVTPYMHARADVGILSTAEDFAKWMNALTAGSIVAEPTRLFETFLGNDGMPLQYAYGWQTGIRHGFRAVSHTGGYRTGFSSLVVYFPTQDVSITVLTNLLSSPRGAVADLLAARYVPGYVAPNPQHPEKDADPGETRKLAAAILAMLRTGTPDPLIQGMDADDVKGFADYFKGTDSVRFVMRRDVSSRGLSVGGRKLVRMVSIYLLHPSHPELLDFYFGPDEKVAYIGS
ncbi:MAG: serine hydrolase domain-containing protein [Burkholderiales bacterium]